MEKKISRLKGQVQSIAIIGAESTGKTTLAENLAKSFNTVWVPEYAREYVENLKRKYTYEDVVIIAKKQIEMHNVLRKRANHLLFLDTDLIITKVWFQEVYQIYPEWLDNAIFDSKITHYLLCNNDVTWLPDPVRENGGEARDYLFSRYIKEIQLFNVPFSVIGGTGDIRLQNAYNEVFKLIN